MNIPNLIKITNRFLDVPSSDPDDARRRKLLNILLFGVAILAILTLLITVIVLLFRVDIIAPQDRNILLFSGIALLVGSVIFYAINRFFSGWLAGFLFLLFLLVVLSLSDRPLGLAQGRSLFVYTIPVVIASVLLQASASFIFAALGSGAIIVLAYIAGREPNQIAIIGYFFLALVSWLSARSLDQALSDLRTINVNLDKIVTERTHALAEALARERIEAG